MGDSVLPRQNVLSSAMIYSGTVDHRRYVDHEHVFRKGLYMLWLPVSVIDRGGSPSPLISRAKFSLLSVVGSDYLAGRQEASLYDRVKSEIFERCGERWEGNAWLLAHPRHFGFVMNPLALIYCYDKYGSLSFVVGEITNTPWGERHCYVFDMRGVETGQSREFTFPKIFHVSPFLPMDMSYTWTVWAPGAAARVGIRNRAGDRLDFEAFLDLVGEPLTGFALIRHMIARPLMTFRVLFGIYWHAAILYFVKRVRFYDHPKFQKGGQR